MALLSLLESVIPLATALSLGGARRRTNLLLTAVTLSFHGAVAWGAALVAATWQPGKAGLLAGSGLPFLAQAVIGVVLLDFSFGYLSHRLMHAHPLLWRFHRLHHLDGFVDATTTYRTHPVESAWRTLFLVVPVWGLGLPSTIVVLYRALSTINGIFEHANIRLPGNLDSALSLLWVTPNMHKVHHSRDRRETDTNYGNILSIHDRWLKTFTTTKRAPFVVYGLEDAAVAA